LSANEISAYGTSLKESETDVEDIKGVFESMGTNIEDAGVIMEGL
jgi:hypothetical protein